MKALVKLSQAKHQFLKITIKQMTETQVLEDELKEVGELNSILLAQKQELEAELDKESHANIGKYSTDSLFL
jgi:hypothetical protein